MVRKKIATIDEFVDLEKWTDEEREQLTLGKEAGLNLYQLKSISELFKDSSIDEVIIARMALEAGIDKESLSKLREFFSHLDLMMCCLIEEQLKNESAIYCKNNSIPDAHIPSGKIQEIAFEYSRDIVGICANSVLEFAKVCAPDLQKIIKKNSEKIDDKIESAKLKLKNENPEKPSEIHDKSLGVNDYFCFR